MRILTAALIYATASCHVIRDPVHMKCYGNAASVDCIRTVFTALLDRESGQVSAPARALVGPGKSDAMTLVVNGVFLTSVFVLESALPGFVELPALPMRPSVNTIELSSRRTVTSLDIPRALPPSDFGSVDTFVELEAENATFTGSVVGPSYVFTTLPSEASSRLAVQLTAPEQFVEFVLPSAANAFSLRFSIPNSPDGYGWDG